MVGNSSSAIIEAASFALPVVNVGNRQKGRFSPGNVIHSDGSIKSIEIAIKKALNPLFNAKIERLKNPYFKPRTAENIINHLLSCESEKTHNFYDL
jgi:UDP-N-acetylglucosamine 2-epimerase